MSAPFRKNELNGVFWSGSGMLFLAFTFSMFTSLLALTSPLFMLLIYDRVLSARSEETLVALFALVITLLVLMGMLDYARRRILARFGARFQELLEPLVFQSAQWGRVDGDKGGDVTGGTSELDGLRRFFHSNGLVHLFDFVWTPIFLGVVFLFHPVLGWVSLTGVLLLCGVSGLEHLFCRHVQEDADAAAAAVRKQRRSIQQAQGVIRDQGLEDEIVNQWRDARRASRELSIRSNDRRGIYRALARQSRMLFQSLILALGASLVLSDQLTIGAMVASFILLSRVFFPVEQFLRQIPAIRSARANWRTLNKLLKEPEDGWTSASSINGDVTLRLNPFHPANDAVGPAVDAAALTIAPGDFVEIVGAEGAGKTCLARALAGVGLFKHWVVTVGGDRVEHLSPALRHDLLGYLPEDVQFYPGSVSENIAGLRSEGAQRAVMAAAKRANAHEMIQALPRGYQTKLDVDGSNLSRAQRHLIGLARAFFNVPKIIILDEPDPILDAVLNSPLFDAAAIDRSHRPSVVILRREARDLPNGFTRYVLRHGQLTQQKCSDISASRVALVPRADPAIAECLEGVA